MIVIDKETECSGCYACSNICPKKCIEMKTDNEGFYYPDIDMSKCINCDLCNKICPVKNTKQDDDNKPECYGCYNKDELVLLDSSSGGIFDLIANFVLRKNGVVYGASLNIKLCEVNHVRIDNTQDIHILRKSKYVQSRLNDTYVAAKKDLEAGKLVLFTGSPCQIEGLINFLGKDYENLYTQDFICHGVPSEKVFKKYAYEYLKNIDCQTPLEFNFRDKSFFWENYSLSATYGNGQSIKENVSKNLFMKSFLSGCNIRPACYECKFKKIHRESDVTLGDFWGVKQVKNEIYNKNGTSIIFIHSKKGQEIFNQIKQNLDFVQVDFDDAVKYNPSYYSSTKLNKKRYKFFKYLDKIKFKKLVFKYCEKPCLIRLINNTNQTIKKVLKYIKK